MIEIHGTTPHFAHIVLIKVGLGFNFPLGKQKEISVYEKCYVNSSVMMLYAPRLGNVNNRRNESN